MEPIYFDEVLFYYVSIYVYIIISLHYTLYILDGFNHKTRFS